MFLKKILIKIFYKNECNKILSMSSIQNAKFLFNTFIRTSVGAMVINILYISIKEPNFWKF